MAARLSSSSLLLPHFGDWIQLGHPSWQGHSVTGDGQGRACDGDSNREAPGRRCVAMLLGGENGIVGILKELE
jgi:hypothetical protein